MTKLLYIIMVMDENSIRNGLIWGERTLKGLNNTHGFPISVYGIGRLNKK